MSALLALTRLTVANGLRQPTFWLTIGLGLVLLLLSIIFGQFNFLAGDRMSLFFTAGVAINVLGGLFLGVVGAATAIHDELSSRTALTLFAKPVSRSSFLIGKTLGAWLVATAACVVLAGAHLLAIWIVNIYGFDLQHRRLSHGPGGYDPLVTTVPWLRLLAAHGLALANTLILTCIAASLALRLPLIANLLICFAVFVAAHLLWGMGIQGAVVLPALGLLNLDESLQFQELQLSLPYFTLCLLYTCLYSAGSLLVGLSLFKHQDIP